MGKHVADCVRSSRIWKCNLRGENTHRLPGTPTDVCMSQWILLWLALLVVSSAAGQTTPPYVAVHRSMTWSEARQFCQNNYVDLAVPSTEEEYVTVINTTASNTVSFWLGLRRQSIFSRWMWVSGEELGYQHWYRVNMEGRCASLEAMKEGKLLARFCNELHMVVCQGPVSPDSIVVTSVGADYLSLSWNVSSFMQLTPHSYNVRVCNGTSCSTLFYSQTKGSSFAEILITNLSSASQYFISVAAFVTRPDPLTGREKILQNDPTTVEIRTASPDLLKFLALFLKFLKVLSLVPSLWFLCYVMTKDRSGQSDLDSSCEIHQSEDAVGVLIA